jgi:hypothetical protein
MPLAHSKTQCWLTTGSKRYFEYIPPRIYSEFFQQVYRLEHTECHAGRLDTSPPHNHPTQMTATQSLADG